jgi:hypothetical protein
MALDIDLAYQLIGNHLHDEGSSPVFVRDWLRLGIGDLRLRIERAAADDDGQAVSTMVWVEVTGFEADRILRVDVSGWGMTAQDQAMDLAHGVLHSILPPIRRIVRDPLLAAMEPSLSITSVTGDDVPLAWAAWIGEPWVVVTADEAATDVDRAADEVRARWATLDPPPVARIFDAVVEVLGEPRTHWAKLYVAGVRGSTSGRVDLDGEPRLDGGKVFGDMVWPRGGSVCLLRQLVVLRPDPGQTPDPRQVERIRAYERGEPLEQPPRRRWRFGRRRPSD